MRKRAKIFSSILAICVILAGWAFIIEPGVGALISPGDAPKSWASGWVDFEYGSLYVSKGIGTSIFPVRLNAPPEFVILELKP